MHVGNAYTAFALRDAFLEGAGSVLAAGRWSTDFWFERVTCTVPVKVRKEEHNMGKWAKYYKHYQDKWEKDNALKG